MSDRPTLTDADVWRLATERVNADELAAYAGIPIDVARAWISRVVAKAMRPAKEVPSVAAIRAAHGVSRATAYRWRAAALATKGAR
jgi:hypothetical protein